MALKKKLVNPFKDLYVLPIFIFEFRPTNKTSGLWAAAWQLLTSNSKLPDPYTPYPYDPDPLYFTPDSNLDRQRAQRAGRHGDWSEAARPARPSAPPTAVPAAQGLYVQAGIGGQSGLLRVNRLSSTRLMPLRPENQPTNAFSMAAASSCCFQRVHSKNVKKKSLYIGRVFMNLTMLKNCKENCKCIVFCVRNLSGVSILFCIFLRASFGTFTFTQKRIIKIVVFRITGKES